MAMLQRTMHPSPLKFIEQCTMHLNNEDVILASASILIGHINDKATRFHMEKRHERAT